MFSLQTIFGSGKQFYGLLEDAAAAAYESAKALHDILSPKAEATGLEAIKLARQRQLVRLRKGQGRERRRRVEGAERFAAVRAAYLVPRFYTPV